MSKAIGGSCLEYMRGATPKTASAPFLFCPCNRKQGSVKKIEIDKKRALPCVHFSMLLPTNARFRAPKPPYGGFGMWKLSKREQEVVELLAQGM